MLADPFSNCFRMGGVVCDLGLHRSPFDLFAFLTKKVFFLNQENRPFRIGGGRVACYRTVRVLSL